MIVDTYKLLEKESQGKTKAMVYLGGFHKSDGLNHHHPKNFLKNNIPSSKPQSQSQNLKDVSQANSDAYPG